MPYDVALATRIHLLLDGQPRLEEKKMFGGVGFILRGNMACGVHHNDLIARVGPESYAQFIGQPGVRPFDITGRPMKGWVMVDPKIVEDDQALRDWVQRSVTFTLTLPEK